MQLLRPRAVSRRDGTDRVSAVQCRSARSFTTAECAIRRHGWLYRMSVCSSALIHTCACVSGQANSPSRVERSAASNALRADLQRWREPRPATCALRDDIRTQWARHCADCVMQVSVSTQPEPLRHCCPQCLTHALHCIVVALCGFLQAPPTRTMDPSPPPRASCARWVALRCRRARTGVPNVRRANTQLLWDSHPALSVWQVSTPHWSICAPAFIVSLRRDRRVCGRPLTVARMALLDRTSAGTYGALTGRSDPASCVQWYALAPPARTGTR